MKNRKKLGIFAALVAYGVLTATFVHIDWLPSINTYGYSVGTNNNYCSVEIVHWQPELSCEHIS